MAEIREFGPLAARDGEPAFAEAWQAEVLALAYALAEQGVFTPGAWSDALGAALRRAQADGAPDTQETYDRAALAALEQLLASDGRIGPDALDGRADRWRRAYLNTPHGQPVELDAADRAPHGHEHEHGHGNGHSHSHRHS